MLPEYTPEDLISFENEVADIFNKGEIRAPVHLYSNNEKEMIKIFKGVKSQDWVFCSWRSHYQCLLKGVPKKQLMQEIMAGKSISRTPKAQNLFFALLAGCCLLPLERLSIKQSNADQKVHCFWGHDC